MHSKRRSLSMAFVVAFTACGFKQFDGQVDTVSVSGNYDVTYDNKVTLRLDLAGGVREVTQAGLGGVADFGVYNGQPLTLDVSSFCAKPEVQCPSETFWSKVAVDEPDIANRASLQKLVVVDNRQHTLDAGVRAVAIAGLIDHHQSDKFLLGLGAGAASSANCVALSLSLAGGRFTRVGETFDASVEYRLPNGRRCDPDAGGSGGDAGDAGTDGGVPVCGAVQVVQRIVPVGAVVDGIAEGQVVVGYAGACAFGAVVGAATLTISTGFTGHRTGAYDPPPFTPAPVVLPDAGLDGGLWLGDAGSP